MTIISPSLAEFIKEIFKSVLRPVVYIPFVDNANEPPTSTNVERKPPCADPNRFLKKYVIKI